MDWTLEDDMVDGSSLPNAQAAEEPIPHLYKQERKRPTLVRRRLSGHRLFLDGSFGGVVAGRAGPSKHGAQFKT